VVKKFLILSNIENKKNFKNISIPFISCIKDKKNLTHYDSKVDYINQYESNNKLILKDAKYLHSIYEKKLLRLSKVLNDINQVEYSERFWRILIGPWLGMFLYTYFLKWKTISKIKSKNSKYKIKIYKIANNELIPNNMEEFSDFIKSEVWQQKISQKVCLNFFFKKNLFYEKNLSAKYSKNEKISVFRNIVIKVINNLTRKKNNKFFIINSYLGLVRETILNLKLFQLPTLHLKDNIIFKSKINYKIRDKIKKDFNRYKFKNRLERNFTNDFISEIPISFIEGFKNLEYQSKKLNYPKKPKTIFSSNFSRNTLLSYYIGEKIELGSKLLIGQHGGLYGAALFSWFENHEIKIADKYFSWGWSQKNSNIKKLGIIVKTKNVKWSKNNKKILIFLRSRNKYPSSFLSGTNTENYLSYTENFSIFLKKINFKIRKNMILRYPANIKNFEEENFKKNYENIPYEKNEMFMSLKKTSLAINTTHSTPFLQIMAINFPNILLMDGKTNPLKDMSSFEILKKVNIFHDNPESAAKFINNLDSPEKIYNWWYSRQTQKAVSIFCKKHAKKNKQIINDIKFNIKNE
jgi:putative transferase (TIGR04331 family)